MQETAIKQKGLLRELGYAFHVIFHPFDGFWCLRREGRGSLASGLILLALLMVTYVLRQRFSGYLFLEQKPEDISALVSVATVLVPVFLWVVANWCLTTLMDGESTMKDILVSVAYATVPLTLFNLPLALFSSIASLDESMFYGVFAVLPLIWVGFLLFASVLSGNQYTAGKTLASMALTVLAIAIIVFLAILFVNMLGQVYAFVYSIVKELSYRV